MKKMKTDYSRQSVYLQRLDSEKREIKVEHLLHPFHNPADGHESHRHYETAQKPVSLLLDFFGTHQLVLNL
jgi:hypothetical protein